MYEIHTPSTRYPKEVNYIREWEIEVYLSQGWRLVGVQPIKSSVINFLVEKDG